MPQSNGNPQEPAAKEEKPKDPVQEEYEQGREFLKNNDIAQAANSFHNALLGFEEREDNGGVANASDKLGDICLERKDYTNALTHFMRAFAICETEADDFSLIALNWKIAKIRRAMGEPETAVAIYLDLLESYRLFKDPAKTVETLETLAETYEEMGDRAKAAEALRTAAGIHQNFKHTRHAQALLTRAEAVARGV